MHDPFIGTWKLNPGKSQFDPNHRPSEGTMRWELDADGTYVMKAEGLNGKGERVVERPQRLIPDGQPYPVPDFPGLHAVTSRPQPNAIHAEVRREDGRLPARAVTSWPTMGSRCRQRRRASIRSCDASRC